MEARSGFDVRVYKNRRFMMWYLNGDEVVFSLDVKI